MSSRSGSRDGGRRAGAVATVAGVFCLLAWGAAGPVCAGGAAADSAAATGGAAVGTAAEQLCHRLELIVSAAPGTIVRTLAGVFPDEVAGCERRGWLLLVSGSWLELGEQQAPIDRIVEGLTAEGWEQLPDYAADGPDGTLIGLAGGGLLCLVQGAWDGGDDADPAAIPSEVYQVTVLCARAGPCPPAEGR